jgi:membrane carboxypeptidase/penicillin-binding protein
MAGLAPYVAGKTGTTDDENDAWFVGFNNEVTVAVWVGYDNAGGKRRTLGEGATGGHTAVPIFEPIMQAVWASVAPRTALAPPSPEAMRQLSCKSIDAESGKASEGKRQLTECFRLDPKGKIADTQYRLLSRESSNAARESRRERPRRTAEPRSSGYSYGWGWSNGGWQHDYRRNGYGNYQRGYDSGGFFSRW